MGILLICTNIIFLTAYIMFIGTQGDQLMCKTLKVAPCGINYVYSSAVLIALLPVLYIRTLAGVGYFSMTILFFTLAAYCIIIAMTIIIVKMSPEEARDTYGLDLTDEDREYN